MKICTSCKLEKSNNEFYRIGKKGPIGRCKRCFNDACMLRWKTIKIKAIEYKGKTCIDCKHSFHPVAIDFHHLNPEEKDYDWTKLRLHPWDEIVKELDKCVLLCSNCHRTRHAGVWLTIH